MTLRKLTLSLGLMTLMTTSTASVFADASAVEKSTRCLVAISALQTLQGTVEQQRSFLGEVKSNEIESGSQFLSARVDSDNYLRLVLAEKDLENKLNPGTKSFSFTSPIPLAPNEANIIKQSRLTLMSMFNRLFLVALKSNGEGSIYEIHTGVDSKTGLISPYKKGLQSQGLLTDRLNLTNSGAASYLIPLSAGEAKGNEQGWYHVYQATRATDGSQSLVLSRISLDSNTANRVSKSPGKVVLNTGAETLSQVHFFEGSEGLYLGAYIKKPAEANASQLSLEVSSIQKNGRPQTLQNVIKIPTNAQSLESLYILRDKNTQRVHVLVKAAGEYYASTISEPMAYKVQIDLNKSMTQFEVLSRENINDTEKRTLFSPTDYKNRSRAEVGAGD